MTGQLCLVGLSFLCELYQNVLTMEYHSVFPLDIMVLVPEKLLKAGA